VQSAKLLEGDEMSRRLALRSAGAALLVGLTKPAFAEERYLDDLGGKLDSYTDPIRSFKIYIPDKWPSSEDLESKNYSKTWQSDREKESTVQVLTARLPKGVGPFIEDLGDPATVGTKYAGIDNAKLLSSVARKADDGSLVYVFDLEGEATNELLAVTINQGKLYEVRAKSSKKLWSKRKDMYKSVIKTFEPEVQSFEYTYGTDQKYENMAPKK
jgi:hypothetical protein